MCFAYLYVVSNCDDNVDANKRKASDTPKTNDELRSKKCGKKRKRSKGSISCLYIFIYLYYDIIF